MMARLFPFKRPDVGFLPHISGAPVTLVFLALFYGSSLQAQTPLWTIPALEQTLAKTAQIPDLPDFDKGLLLQLDLSAMQGLGRTAQSEFSNNRSATTIIDLPLPDGSFQQFQIWESPLMEPALAAKYPEIKTYLLKGVDDPLATGRMSVSPDEFGAFFNAHQYGQDVYIRKALKNSTALYLSYWGKEDPSLQKPFNCLWEGPTMPSDAAHKTQLAGPYETGDVLRVFRLAMTIPGKLSEAYGWTTKAQVLSSLVAFLGQLNTIFERDLSVRFVLPEKQENILFLTETSDPFTALGGGEAANENILVTNQLIGQDGFDVGLIFVTGACCAAGKPTICSDYKAWNFSAFYSLRVTAHEIGHQFNADHTWTSCGPSNNGQFGTNEYGSGTSIMSYANICGVDNILPVGEETIFGVYSQIQMCEWINAQACYKSLETGNHIPSSTVPPSGFYIPISTPFELAGSASDPDGDQLSYSWEQVNIRNIDFTASNISIQTPPTPEDGNVPIARIFNPTSSPRRTIPQLSDILSNTSTVNERLPTYSRNIKYRMYVRDNHPGAGGTTHEQVSFEVDGSAGPFLVTAPNNCVSWQAGSSQTITWDVANTNNALVNCQNVKISLSLDGGYTYPHVLAASTTNDGSETITLPGGICSNKSRIKVEAVGNIFFDVSNTDLNIENNGTAIVKAEALQLDGSDDQVEIQDASLGNFGTGDFTLEMWAKTTDNNCALMGKRPICNCDNFWNYFIDNGRIRAEFSTSNTCSGYLNSTGQNNTLANGEWHHIAFVRQGTSLRFYVDGVLDLNTFSNQDFNNPAKISIGNIVCGGQNFPGSMDEIRIWNISRSEAEINDKMHCTLEGNEAGLQAYYPINSQDCGVCAVGTSILTDKTANGYHAALQNGAHTSLSTIDIQTCPVCVNGPIVLNANPLNQSVSVGETATFTVDAAGNNLSYQWYRSTDGGGTFTEINAATLSEYSFVVSSSIQNGWQFKCLLSNGCDLKFSESASLNMPCPTQTLSSITGPANPCANNYYTYFVSPNPNMVSWAWATPADWAVTNYGNMIFVKATATPGTISVTGTDACGVTTAAQTFAVVPVSVNITTQPISQTVNEGSVVDFYVAVSSGGGTTNFLWQESQDGGQTYTAIPGATASSHIISSVTLSQDGSMFRCIVTNGCLIDTTDVALLAVNCTASAPAVPAAILGADLICASAAAMSYSVAAVPGATAYLWSLPVGWTGSSSTNTISVQTNGTAGDLKVKSVNSCGASEAQTLSIAINADACRRGVHFDGIDDYLSIAQNGQAVSGDMTLTFWTKPDLGTGDQTMIFNGREFIVGLSNGHIRYKHSDDCCGYDNTVEMFFPGFLEPGQWTHVAITRSTANRTVDLYLNGNHVESKTYGGASAQPGDHATDMIFGAGKNGSWSNFKGSLDEVRLWNVVRSLDDLKEDLVCYPTGIEPDLKAYYDFETGQPFGDNQAVTGFSNLATAYGIASVRNLAMSGTGSNIVSGDQPSFLFQDLDGDGFGGAKVGCTYAGATVANSDDCDDQNQAVHPFTEEICNGIDDDCSGVIDDLPNVFVSTNVPVPIPEGQTISSKFVVNTPVNSLVDLNVFNLNISHIWIADLRIRLRSPQGTEITLVEWICGDQDNMLINFDDEANADYGSIPCPPTNNGTYKPFSPLSAFDGENPNGEWTLLVEDVYEDAGVLNAWSIGFPSVPQTLFADADQDGYGNPAESILACTATPGYVSDGTDCDDANDQIHPGATEVCNNLDDDCDGLTDEELGPIWYADADGDGFGNALTSLQACTAPTGYVSNASDCDDNNAQSFPGANEICNSLDDDCDGLTDEELLATWYVDADGDGFGIAATNVFACTQPTGYVPNSGDCDDSNNAIYPEALEVLNDLDDDCDGVVDDSTNISSIHPALGDNTPELQFALYPNPTDEVLNIVFSGTETVVGKVEIYNSIGQRMLTQDMEIGANKAGVLSVSPLPSGHYFLVFRSAEGPSAGEWFILL